MGRWVFEVDVTRWVVSVIKGVGLPHGEIDALSTLPDTPPLSFVQRNIVCVSGNGSRLRLKLLGKCLDKKCNTLLSGPIIRQQRYVPN